MTSKLMTRTADVPRTIGRYQVLRPLGQGCMSQVYLAHEGDEVRVAVKVCRPGAVKRFDWATRLQGEIDHPNVMKYRALPFDPQYQYLVVTDYLEVVPANFARLMACTFEEIVQLYARAAEALAFLESKGVTHGNVKPSNILCRRTRDGFYPLVSDTGLRYVNDPEYLTDNVVAAGIYAYMAPEHLQAFATPNTVQPASSKGDVYSLMVSLVEALTGTVPFRLGVDNPADPQQVLAAKSKKSYRLIFKNDPTTPLDARLMDELMRECLSPEPRDRPRLTDLAARLDGTIDRERLQALEAVFK